MERSGSASAFIALPLVQGVWTPWVEWSGCVSAVQPSQRSAHLFFGLGGGGRKCCASTAGFFVA